MKRKYLPEIGKCFGKWTVISEEVRSSESLGGKSHRISYWNVRCSCGHEGWREATFLVTGRTLACKSCCKDDSTNSSRLRNFLRKAKSGARIRGILWDDNLTIDLLSGMYERQEGRCAISGTAISFTDKWKDKKGCTCSLDRIDSNSGYVIGNVHLVHKRVNLIKRELSMEEFLIWCHTISDFQRKHGIEEPSKTP